MVAKEVKVCGELAEILSSFEAPENVANKIARRAGAVVGNGLSHKKVESVIIDNMNFDGTPQWSEIFKRLGEAANRVYKGKRPF